MMRNGREIGTIYKQELPFLARKLGPALVARNAAAHLEGPLADMAGGGLPLVDCWRGGQRSGSFATDPKHGSVGGWRLIAGGYKAWRVFGSREVPRGRWLPR